MRCESLCDTKGNCATLARAATTANKSEDVVGTDETGYPERTYNSFTIGDMRAV